MADVTRKVHPDYPSDGLGADHATIAAAVSYLTDTWNQVGVGTIQLIDKVEYVEDGISLDGWTGTASNYVILEAADSAREDGHIPWTAGTAASYDDSCAAVRGTGGDHVIYIKEDYTIVRKIAVFQDNDGSSDEGITMRTSGLTDVLIEKCTIITRNYDQQDCIYTYYGGTQSLTVYDCLLVPGGANARSGINAQSFGAHTLTRNIFHCLINGNGVDEDSSSGDSGCILYQDGGGTLNDNIYNNLLFDVGTTYGEIINRHNSIGTANYAGSGNVGDSTADTTVTTKLGGTKNTEIARTAFGAASDDDVRFTSYTSAMNADYQLISGSGTDIAIDYSYAEGSFDTRVDDDLDIAGNSRPTAADRDAGPYEVAASGTTVNQTTTETLGLTTPAVTVGANRTVNQTSTETLGLTTPAVSVDPKTQVDQTATETLGLTTPAATVLTNTTVSQTATETLGLTTPAVTVGANTVIGQTATETLGLTTPSVTVSANTQIDQTATETLGITTPQVTVLGPIVVNQTATKTLGLTTPGADVVVGSNTTINQQATETLGLTTPTVSVLVNTVVNQTATKTLGLTTPSATVSANTQVDQTATETLGLTTPTVSILYPVVVGQTATQTLGLTTPSVTVNVGTSTYTIDGASNKTITENYGSLRLYDSGGGSYYSW